MATRSVLGGRFESEGRSFDVTLVRESGAIEVIEYEGISPIIVARGAWDDRAQRVVDLRAVKPDWSGDLARLAADATAKLLREPGGP